MIQPNDSSFGLDRGTGEIRDWRKATQLQETDSQSTLSYEILTRRVPAGFNIASLLPRSEPRFGTLPIDEVTSTLCYSRDTNTEVLKSILRG